MRNCCLIVVIVIISVAGAAQEDYAVPGKFILVEKNHVNMMSVLREDVKRFHDKMREIFVARKLFRLFNPERIGGSSPDLLQSASEESLPTHIIYYWLSVKYQALAVGGIFKLEGDLEIEKFAGGQIWQAVSAKLHSARDLGFIVADAKDLRRQCCIDELAARVAEKLMRKLLTRGLLIPTANDQFLSARLCQKTFRAGDCISIDFSWSRQAPGTWYLYILYFHHHGTIDMLLPNFRIRKFLVAPESCHSWPGTTGRKVSREKSLIAQKRWGISRIIAGKDNERALIVISARPIDFLEEGLASILQRNGRILSLTIAEVKKLRQQLAGKQYASRLLDITNSGER